MDRDALIALDRQHVWRPYTSSEDHESQDPLVIERAEGPWLYDANGRRYLDGSGSWWCNNLGHGHPRLRQVFAMQAQSLMHCSFAGTTHAPAATLAQRLVALAPEGLERVFYSDNGSTAVEVALKMAFQYWQQNDRPERTRFLALPGGYHGDTVGAMSVSAVDAFNGVFSPLLFDAVRGPEPAHSDDDAGWEALTADIEKTLREQGDTVAGLIVEPMVQGAAGMRMYPAWVLERLRKATHAADTFLIADEVFTGFGRTGTFWACDHAGIAPDLLATAKGLTGGMTPFSATLATARIYDGFRGNKTRALMHGHTFCGHPLGAAVALEVLDIYQDDKIMQSCAARSAQLAEGIAALGEEVGVRSRSLGMVAAADLGAGGYLGGIGWRVHDEARKRGAQIRPLGDTVYVVPPLNITEEDLATLIGVLRESVAAATA